MKKIDNRWLALVAATGIVLYLCWRMVEPFLDVILWAAVLAIVSFPLCRRWRERGLSHQKAAMLTTLVVVFVVLIPLTFIAIALYHQAQDAAAGLQQGAQKILTPGSTPHRVIGRFIDPALLSDRDWWVDQFQKISGTLVQRSLGVIGGVLGGVVQIFFVLFTLYFLLRDSDRIVPAIKQAIPLTPVQTETVFRRSREVIDASLKGVLVIAAIQGALGMLAFFVLGLPSALLWGVIMFLLSTIPMVGSGVIWLPAAIFLLATGHYIKGTILILWGGLVIGLVDNMLRPKLVGQKARLHELIIFFGVLGGLKVFGILGLFVGPVVAAIAIALADVFRQANEVEAVNEGVRQETVGAGDGLSSPIAVPAPAGDGMTNDEIRMTNQ